METKTILLKKVTVYVEGASAPSTVYPAMREDAAIEWAAKVQEQLNKRGWNHIVRIEQAR